MLDFSVLREHLNSYTAGYVFLADDNKNVFMEIPYSNLKEISVSDDLHDQAILNDPLAWYAPVRRYAEWTLRFGKLINEDDPSVYTIVNHRDADPEKLEALLNECV